jgi:hypothetical protein
MPIKLNGATSGSVELDVPAVVGSDLQLTLPATAGDVVVKASNGSVDLGDVGIDSSGRLLVGTSSETGSSTVVVRGRPGVSLAEGQLELGRNQPATTPFGLGDPLGKILFTDNGSNVYGQIVCEADGTSASGDYPGSLVFSTTIDGTNSPTARLRIDNRGQHSFQSSGAPSTDNLLTTVAGASSGARLLSFRHSGTLGSIGTGTESCAIRRNGDIANTNNSYTALSDVKLKENIVDATSQWDDVKNLQVRKYNFKVETGNETHTQIGLIAQEVELVCPGLVGESPDIDNEGNDLDTTTKIVNYSVLYMKAVKALQEAMERIETLETKVAALEATP